MRSAFRSRAKGFTLVEVVVVLVILAILAAILIPAMTGWIEEARAKKCMHEMGQIAHDYGACAATSGYGKVAALDTAACVREACNDIFGSDHGASGISYLGSCGQTITLFLSDEEDVVIDAFCPLHGSLTGKGGGVRPVTPGNEVGALLKRFFDSGNPLPAYTSIDSTSTGQRPDGTDYLTTAITAWFAAEGIDLSAQDVASWSVRNANNDGKWNVFWSDVDVAAQFDGQTVRAIRYDEAKNQYSVGYVPVVKNTSTKHNVLGTTGSNAGFQKASGSAEYISYDEAVAAFNALAKLKD